jgi:hypothetical protein
MDEEKSGSNTLQKKPICYTVGLVVGYFRLPCGHSRRTRQCRSRAGARHIMCELTHGMAGERHGRGILCVNPPLVLHRYADRHINSKCPSVYIVPTNFLFIWRNTPQWARAPSFPRILHHIQQHTKAGRTPLDEWSARRRDLCLTTNNTHNRRTSMPPVRFELTISEAERPQIYVLDRAATGTGKWKLGVLYIVFHCILHEFR